MVRGPQSRALLSIHGVQCVRGQTWESRVESGQEMKVGCWCFGPCSVRLELELKGQTVPHTSLEKPSYITGDCCWLGLKNLYRSERDWGLQTHSGASGAPHRCANNSSFFFPPWFKPFRWILGSRRHRSEISGSCRTNWKTNSHTGSLTHSFICRGGALGRWAGNNIAHVVLSG